MCLICGDQVESKNGVYCPKCLKILKAQGRQCRKRFVGYFYTNGKL